MKFFKRKPETRRRVFGFLCDQKLAAHVRRMAEIMQVPIYCYAEHLLQLGLAHMAFEISGNPGNMEPMLEELRGHLLRQHLLVDRLGDEEFGRRLIDKHAGLPPEQEQVSAIIGLVNDFRDQGIPHDVVIEVVRKSVAQLQVQRRIQQIRREIDFKMLMEINRRFPRLIPGLLRVTAKYSAQDLLDALSPLKR